MDSGFYVAIGCIIASVALGLSMAKYNLKVLRETKQERLEARRAYKKKKNAALARFLGIDYKPKDD